MKPIHLDGIEVYRTDSLWSDSKEFQKQARTIALLHFVPVVQIEGRDTVLYAISSGAIRQAKKGKRATSPEASY